MDKSYRDLFFGEAQEYLREINRALVKLEKEPADLESMNIIFRLTHTLKGMAATMGYKELAEFAHQLENAFDKFRSGKIDFNLEVMDVIFESIDAFAALVDDFRENRPFSIDTALYVSKIEKIIARENKGKVIEVKKIEEDIKIDIGLIDKFKEEGCEVLRVAVVLAKDCFMKGVRAFLVLERSRKMGTVVKSFPGEAELKEEEFDYSFEFILATRESREAVQKELFKIIEIEKVDISIFDLTGLDKFEKKVKTNVPYLKKIQSMRIPVERLDKIMNLMGELAIAKSRLVQTMQAKDYVALEETGYIFERLVPGLQDELLKLRLLPISYILDNFPRVVRDLSRSEGKEIDLKIIGSEIELDRVILDDIGDPLIHIIRNSVDHGIELPDERIKSGKPRHGKISIKVSREKGHIILEIADDGKGIDFDKVVKRALSKNLIKLEETINIDSAKIFDILAAPGFSTKEEVTELSGRGVGLDVVKNTIESLGGRVELESELGKGTKFVLTLPLTLAIIKAMLVSVGEQIYAIPLMNIRETVKINKNDIKLVKDLEVIRIRDEVIPVIRLSKELNIKSFKDASAAISVVIVEGRIKNIGFVVDNVLSEQDIVVKPLSSFIKKVKGITGATILGDGGVALILDVASIR
jgi:two-component system chemotaxis sensor kinase CheA